MKQHGEELILSAETIDRLSELLAEDLTVAETDKRDVLRIRLSLEEILDVWTDKLQGAAVLYRAVQKFGRLSIEVCVEGMEINADEESGELLR